MRYTAAEAPELKEPDAPYAIRLWSEGDDDNLLSLLDASREFGRWSAPRFAREMRGLMREAQFFAWEGDVMAAATGVLDRPLDGSPAWEIAWVVRDPGHRGFGLGEAVVRHSVHAALKQFDPRPVFLYTDDERLTAIQIYLDLGFEPDLESHRSYRPRWKRIERALADRRSTAHARRS